MKLDRHLHQQIRLQNWLFTILFLGLIGLLGWLSQHYATAWDWTASGRHTLSEASRKVLDTLKEPVTITAYAREENQEVRERIRDLVTPYQRHKPDLTLVFVNPDLHPDKVRELGITMDGELVIEYQGRREKLTDLSEAGLTNALLRLASSEQRTLVFVTGHGERDPLGDANFDLGQFGHALQQRGFKIETWNPVQHPKLPEGVTALVIASPQTTYLPGEVKLLRAYLEQGGNLWWLLEPGDLKGLKPLAEQLGIEPLPGTIVDPSGQILGIADPTFVLVAQYPPHPITRNLRNLSLFPGARALESGGESPFHPTPFLETLPRTWTETGPLEGEIRLDPDQGEREGPLTLGLTLTREFQREGEKEPVRQRIVVVGDGDFLTNTYLGNGANQDLGLNAVQWLTHQDRFIDIPAHTAPDTQLNLSPLALTLIAFGFLLLLPAGLLACGGILWWRRRRA
ncbi:hypothetical protein MIT9_P1882 [Methylomarinovum caldicuralii]|uniref:ABC transporter n=1 Tax=Methylomarinovum caldicuralii TaxID=438856 RepID=A0AAU9C9Q3_9GAMM|nr:GldG family protein [Methylomarinovum caldicuralii]BCX82296.1 hypothetical protein MIT9_P1882 [Methylomarinovum caldicuralii]